jgi:hypothetical protein
MPLAIEACVGRVVRLLPDGFAVKFVEEQKRNDLERLVMRPTPPRSAGGFGHLGATVAPSTMLPACVGLLGGSGATG